MSNSRILTFDVLLQGINAAASPLPGMLISFYDATLDAATSLYRQIETAIVVGSITGSGNVTVIVTAAGMTGSPRTLSVPVLIGDVAAVVAAKIRAALKADADIGAFFTFSGIGATIVAQSVTPAANDATMNISIANGTSTGLTNVATSNHGIISDASGAVAQPTIAVVAATNVRCKSQYQGMVNYVERQSQ